jgi:hypothetical protein
MPVQKQSFGTNKEFHKKLENKAPLTHRGLGHSNNIQKAFKSVIEGDAKARILTHDEFADKQLEAKWQADVSNMKDWCEENINKLKDRFRRSYTIFTSDLSLKNLPARGNTKPDISASSKYLSESIGVSRQIIQEVQSNILEGIDDLTKYKEAMKQEEQKISKRYSKKNISSMDDTAENMGFEETQQLEEENDEFEKDFRPSVNGNRDISSYTFRQSKDGNTAFGEEFPSRPQPKYAQNTQPKTNFTGISTGATATSKATTSKATISKIPASLYDRTMVGVKKARKGENDHKPIHSFFQSSKGPHNQNDEPDEFL